MSQPARQALYTLPTEFPEDTACWRIEIPNDDQYATLLIGAINTLTYWSNYLRDEDHTGALVANYFKKALLTLRECGEGMLEDVRQNLDYPCKLDKKVEGGEWEEFANLQKCPPRLRITDGGIQYSTDDGATWIDYPNDGSLGGQPGEQPGGDQPIDAGDCKSVVCLVPGNSQFIVPFRVLPGDTLEIAGVQGAWTNDMSGAVWSCFEGTVFVLGSCGGESPLVPTGIDGVHKASRLIARYGSAFLDPVGGVVTIPSGDEFALVFQMNDEDLPNNGGSMSFVATICSGMWEYIWFGETGSYTNFTLIQGSVIEGVGIEADSGAYPVGDYARLTITLPSGDYSVTSFSAVWTETGGGSRLTLMKNATVWDGTNEFFTQYPGGSVSDIDITGDVVPGDYIGIQLSNDSNNPSSRLTGFSLKGMGSNPFI